MSRVEDEVNDEGCSELVGRYSRLADALNKNYGPFVKVGHRPISMASGSDLHEFWCTFSPYVDADAPVDRLVASAEVDSHKMQRLVEQWVKRCIHLRQLEVDPESFADVRAAKKRANRLSRHLHQAIKLGTLGVACGGEILDGGDRLSSHGTFSFSDSDSDWRPNRSEREHFMVTWDWVECEWRLRLFPVEGLKAEMPRWGGNNWIFDDLLDVGVSVPVSKKVVKWCKKRGLIHN